MHILAIDIGIINMGYVLVSLDTDTVKFNVIHVDKYDITLFNHDNIKLSECTLCHDFNLVDYTNHFIQEKKELFDKADIVLIERQPPGGITSVQDLIMAKFRDKSRLMHPRSIHTFHGLGKLDYEARKDRSIELTNKYLSNHANFTRHLRKHDMSDAMLMALMYIGEVKKKNEYEAIKLKWKTAKYNIEDLEKFRYKKKD